MSTAIGISWWAYSFAYNIISPPLKTIGISGLIEGFWQFAGIFFAYIIRKPGSALIGETLAATIEGLISQWGISAIFSGISQALPVELIFFICRYKVWNIFTLMLAGMASALGGYIISYYWYGYNHLSITFNEINLTCNLISGAVLGGLLARHMANLLLSSGTLNQFEISKNHVSSL